MKSSSNSQGNAPGLGTRNSSTLFSIAPLILMLGVSFWPHSKIVMSNSPSVPAAKGVIHASHDSNKNTKLEMSVHYLAEPGALTPSAASYVVWLQPDNDSAQNKGELKIGKDRSGDLTIVTPLRRFAIFVTPEPSAQATSPTGEHVLSANVSQ
jgi:hypothetical protein